MRKIRDVLRYRYSTELSLEAIARALNISKGVVAKYLRLAKAASIGWPLPEGLDDAALERCLYRQSEARVSAHVEPDYARVHQELKKKGVTLTLLWEEYREGVGDRGFQYTAFCTRYRDWAGKLKRSMRQIHRAGEKLFADYAGPTLPIIDAQSGEIRPASIFVAVLGASNYTFACATPGQTQADWLGGLARALAGIGGVPQLIVPDNPRALIRDPNRYEPELNRATAEFAAHYGTVILPARPRKPQDKVLASYCTLFGRLRSDKGWRRGSVATTLSFDQDDIPEGLVEATVAITPAMFRDDPVASPVIDRCRGYTQAKRQFVGGEHATRP
jgi:transposase